VPDFRGKKNNFQMGLNYQKQKQKFTIGIEL